MKSFQSLITYSETMLNNTSAINEIIILEYKKQFNNILFSVNDNESYQILKRYIDYYKNTILYQFQPSFINCLDVIEERTTNNSLKVILLIERLNELISFKINNYIPLSNDQMKQNETNSKDSDKREKIIKALIVQNNKFTRYNMSKLLNNSNSFYLCCLLFKYCLDNYHISCQGILETFLKNINNWINSEKSLRELKRDRNNIKIVFGIEENEKYKKYIDLIEENLTKKENQFNSF